MEMKSGRRERKKAALCRNIVAKAMQLFNKEGFYNVTMEQIAECSDVSKATLYKYFPLKEAIIASYWQEEMIDSKDEFLSVLTKYPNTVAQLIALLELFMIKIMQSSELYQIYIRYRLQNVMDVKINEQLRSGAEQYVLQIILKGQETGEIRSDLPLQLLVSNFEYSTVTLAMIWIHQPDNFNLKDSSMKIVDLFLNGAKDYE